MKFSLRTLLLLGVAAEIAIFLVAYVLQPSLEEAFRYAARYSGRLSAFVFLAAFYLFAKAHPAPLKDSHNVRDSIILFAVLHVIHLGFLATNVSLNEIPLVPTKLIGGGLAYLMIVVAPFALHKVKVPVQLVYFYYVTLVMTITYVARIKGDFEGAEPSWYHGLMIGVFLTAAIYFGWWIRKKSTRKMTS